MENLSVELKLIIKPSYEQVDRNLESISTTMETKRKNWPLKLQVDCNLIKIYCYLFFCGFILFFGDHMIGSERTRFGIKNNKSL